MRFVMTITAINLFMLCTSKMQIYKILLFLGKNMLLPLGLVRYCARLAVFSLVVLFPLDRFRHDMFRVLRLGNRLRYSPILVDSADLRHVLVSLFDCLCIIERVTFPARRLQ